MKNLLIIIIILFAIPSCSQELKRKGSFGLQMANANIEGDSGVKILKVFENSTASNIGLKENDIILNINNKNYNDISSLINYVGSWLVDDKLTVKILRNENEKVLKGQVLGKPYETSEHAKVIYGEVDYDGGKLRSILELPNNIKNPPVVFFLPGVGCGSLDFYYNPSTPTKLLIEGLVSKGIAVYRVEKPGMGDSTGTKDCLEMDFNYEVEAFKTALKKLKTITTIDSNNIFLYGHSLGAISAPLLASENKVAGIVAWGGISTSWFEYNLKQDRYQRALFGVDYNEIDTDFRESLPFRYDYLVNKKTPKELTENPKYKDYVEHYFANGKLYSGMHHYSYFQTLNDVNVLSAYNKANCPVLALAGEFDYHTVDTSWAKEISEAVNYYLPNQGKYIIIPKTTHHYHTVSSIKSYIELGRNGKINGDYMEKHFNHDISSIVANWVKKTTT